MFPCENLLLKALEMEMFCHNQTLLSSGTLLVVYRINTAIASTLVHPHTIPVLFHAK